MKAYKVKGVVCPQCGGFTPAEDFPYPVPDKDLDERYACGECDETYEDKEEAKACCK